jgi:ABC-2 type transport system ATP-binding protein
MAVVRVENLSKRYGARLAVDGISLEVRQHEVMGLLGPNGSGKTTILRILTGYLRPTAGAVSVAGFDVVRQGRSARQRIGYVPEDAPVYPQMRVDEFLEFMGRLRDLDGGGLQAALATARERLGLIDVRDTVIGRLSRGYRQRVSLAQAILHGPDLLVLDEPTNGLDPRQIIEFRDLVRDLARQCTIIITSHILGEIARVADRVAILLGGRLLAVRDLSHTRSICFRTRADVADRVEAVLQTAAAHLAIVREPDADGIYRWRVQASDEQAANRLVGELAAAGMLVIEATGHGADLEETFLELTTQEARR